MFKNKIVLITGGTGSFAKAFLSRLLSIKRWLKNIRCWVWKRFYGL